MATIVITMVFSITLVAILGYTMTASRASRGLGVVNDERRAADSAMERVVAQIRADRTGNLGSGEVHDDCTGSPFEIDLLAADDGAEEGPTVVVDCEVAPGDTADERRVDLRATFYNDESMVNGKSIGAARVRIIDTDGENDHPGYRVTVCDWHIGTLPETAQLAGCVPA